MWRMAYRNQYIDSNERWPSTFFGWLIWFVFFMPGSIALWINYMYPRRGQVWASGRQAQNRIVTVITTLSIYVSVVMMIVLFEMMSKNHR
jgi:hypothetical protein